MNLAVLAGALSSPPQIRQFPSGTRLATLQVRTPTPGGRQTSVPVAIWDPPPLVDRLVTGDQVIVAGPVVRRFYGGGGDRAGSRVEVVADAIAPLSDARQRARVTRRVAETLAHEMDVNRRRPN